MRSTRFFLPVAALAVLASVVAQEVRGERPNIVLILADDLGYGDLACYGNPDVRTPVLDRLAHEGVRFTEHYANGPECSPTRTALLTGRYQQRMLGLECAIGTGNVGRYDEAIEQADQHRLGLPPAAAIIPARLRDQGYRCGLFGKWHLGYEPRFHPSAHRWDDFFGYLGGNVHYFHHRETSNLHVLFEGDLAVYREGYMSDLITESAIDFLQSQPQERFFLLVSHETPHFPYQGPLDEAKEVTADNWMTVDAKAYRAMVEDLDSQVGKVLQAIKQAGRARDTLVIFASDNGGFAGAAHMGGLRGAKGTTWEGGIRVPLILHWPGTLPAGVTCEQPCLTFDLTRSVLQLAGALSSDTDGYDIVQHVRESRAEIHRSLFWRGRRGNRTWRAARDGHLKLVHKDQDGQREQWLFDVRKDPGETQDLASKRPQDLQRMQGLLQEWERDVDRVRTRP